MNRETHEANTKQPVDQRPAKWDIVLLHDTGTSQFEGCLMICEDIKPWGAQGFVTLPHASGGCVYYRALWSQMAFTGGSVAPYVKEHKYEQDDEASAEYLIGKKLFDE